MKAISLARASIVTLYAALQTSSVSLTLTAVIVCSLPTFRSEDLYSHEAEECVGLARPGMQANPSSLSSAFSSYQCRLVQSDLLRNWTACSMLRSASGKRYPVRLCHINTNIWDLPSPFLARARHPLQYSHGCPGLRHPYIKPGRVGRGFSLRSICFYRLDCVTTACSYLCDNIEGLSLFFQLLIYCILDFLKIFTSINILCKLFFAFLTNWYTSKGRYSRYGLSCQGHLLRQIGSFLPTIFPSL